MQLYPTRSYPDMQEKLLFKAINSLAERLAHLELFESQLTLHMELTVELPAPL